MYPTVLADLYLSQMFFSASAVRHSCLVRPVSAQTDTLAGLLVL